MLKKTDFERATNYCKTVFKKNGTTIYSLSISFAFIEISFLPQITRCSTPEGCGQSDVYE